MLALAVLAVLFPFVMFVAGVVSSPMMFVAGLPSQLSWLGTTTPPNFQSTRITDQARLIDYSTATDTQHPADTQQPDDDRAAV